VYPVGAERPNFLDPALTHFDINPETDFEHGSLGFAAELPEATELRIVISNHEAGHDAHAGWGYIDSSVLIWDVSLYDWDTGVQEFRANQPGLANIDFVLQGNGSATVEYFEYGSTLPTRTKEVTWTHISPE
jgi:hypothetical protein